MSSVGQLACRLFAFGQQRRVAKGAALPVFWRGSLTIADQAVASATTFLTGVLIGRVCSKEQFGYYMLGFSLLTFLMTLQSALISTPYTIYLPRVAADGRARFTGSALAHQLVLGAGVAVAVLTGGVFSGLSASGPELSAMLYGLGVAISFLLLRDFIRQACFAQLAAQRALAFDTAVAVVQLAALLALALTGSLTAATAFLGLAAACALSALGWFWLNRTAVDVDPRQACEDFRQNWESAKWLFASGLVWSVSMNLYAWFLAAFHGAASAGTYAAALGVVTLINPVMLGIQNFAGPHIMHAFAEGGPDRLFRVVHGTALLYGGLLVLFSASMFLFGDSIIAMVYGAKYAGNGLVVALLSMNLAFNALGFSFSRGLFALDGASADFKVNFVALGFMVICGVWLARFYGPAGAALGQALANFVASIVRWMAFHSAVRRASPAGAAS
ncbi:MAG: oligosaccharide flippase family protein [Candidatus Hydrogenedentes bacterium]|nr:oligosaccharide flippase family protein [Candidatus Hydrogenedentota bacterium]